MTELSGELTQAMESVINDSDTTIGVGDVFKRFADKIRTVYGTYCREQDSASQLLEKVMSIIIMIIIISYCNYLIANGR